MYRKFNVTRNFFYIVSKLRVWKKLNETRHAKFTAVHSLWSLDLPFSPNWQIHAAPPPERRAEWRRRQYKTKRFYHWVAWALESGVEASCSPRMKLDAVRRFAC